MSSATTPPVLIIGAGLAGLTLAQALRKENVPFRVFERDESLHSRKQGWAIGLHSMLDDLNAALPSDLPPIDVVNHLHPLSNTTAEMRFHEAEAISHVKSTPEWPIIRANRTKLRDWLSTNIPIEYSKRLSSIRQDEYGVTATFQDGSEGHGRVLVGADGVQSSVREFLMPGVVKPQVVPETFVTGEVTLRGAALERQLFLGRSAWIKFVPNGSGLFVGLTAISDDGQQGTYVWHTIYREEGKTNEDRTFSSKKQLYNTALEKLQGLDDEYMEIVHATGIEDVITPPLVVKDAVIESMPNTRVTLIGDAAHPMTPFRGEGGCNAIRDAIQLAPILIESAEQDLLSKLQAFQDEMLKRGAEAVKRSRSAGTAQTDPESRTAWGTKVRKVQQ